MAASKTLRYSNGIYFFSFFFFFLFLNLFLTCTFFNAIMQLIVSTPKCTACVEKLANNNASKGMLLPVWVYKPTSKMADSELPDEGLSYWLKCVEVWSRHRNTRSAWKTSIGVRASLQQSGVQWRPAGSPFVKNTCWSHRVHPICFYTAVFLKNKVFSLWVPPSVIFFPRSMEDHLKCSRSWNIPSRGLFPTKRKWPL